MFQTKLDWVIFKGPSNKINFQLFDFLFYLTQCLVDKCSFYDV